MSPSFTHGKRGQVYRYYVTSYLQQGGPSGKAEQVQRIPGPQLEAQLADALARLVPERAEQALALPHRVEVHEQEVHVLLEAKVLEGMAGRLAANETAKPDPIKPSLIRLTLPVRIRNRRGRTSIQLTADPSTKLDDVMIGALRRAHALVKLDRQRLPICDNAPPTLYERRLLRLAFLAPDLQAMILEGRQPAHLNVEQLVEQPLPIDWHEQRKIFGSAEPRPRAENRKAVPAAG